MLFHIAIPCEGIRYYDRETDCLVDAVCHSSHDHHQEMRFGDVEFLVTMCGHMWNSGARKDIIHEFIGELYGPLTLASKDSRKFNDDLIAYRTGVSHVHAWDLCSNESCGQSATHWDCYLERSKSSYLSKLHPFRMSPYCSFFCWASGHLKRCCVCHSFSESQLDPMFVESSESQCRAILSEIGYSDAIMKMALSRVCSPDCLASHLGHMRSYAAAELKRKGEVQCLKKVRVLLRDAKRHLQNNNLEALGSLKEEFAQAAISQE